jgi:hypothetical protein
MLVANLIAPGDLRVGMYSTDGAATPPGGEIAKLKFTVGSVVAQTTGLHIGEVAQDGGMVWTSVDGSLQINSVVQDRRLFYNNSAFDGGDPAINAADDTAIDSSKSALLPGGTATFANYTSYDKGLNGVMVDIAGLPTGTLSTSDFAFKVGNDNLPGSWSDALAPASIQVRAGAGVGGSGRVEIVWADGQAVKKQWLMVKVLSDVHGGHAGLASDEVFYFGNAVGETGDNPLNAVVNATDENRVAANKTGFVLAPVTNVYDFNHDRRVNATDVLIARDNHTTQGVDALNLITVPLSLAPEGPSGQSAVSPAQGLQLTAGPVVDAVLTSAGTQLNEISWLYQYEEMAAKKQSSEENNSTEKSVDAVLALYWS